MEMSTEQQNGRTVTYNPAVRLVPKRLLQNHKSLMTWLQIFINCSCVIGLLMLSVKLKLGGIPSIYWYLILISFFLTLSIYPFFKVYQQVNRFSVMAMRITGAWFMVCSLLMIVAFITKTSELYSRQVAISWFVTVLICQIIMLKLYYKFLEIYRERYKTPTNTLVVGLGETGLRLVRKLNENRYLPEKVVGMVDAYPNQKMVSKKLPEKVVGDVSEIKFLIEKYSIKKVYITTTIRDALLVEKLNDFLLEEHVYVVWQLNLSKWKLMNLSIRELDGLPLISLNESPVNVNRRDVFFKHLIDKVISVLLILSLSWIFIIVAILLRLTTKDSIIFKQVRHGYSGKEIEIYKFRSMADHDGKKVDQAIKGDVRVTKIGAFIRKTSIDELPQLFNVLQGRMSLVGPRPHAAEHNEKYMRRINLYSTRHRVRPGITGLAQISGARGETETDEKMEQRIKYDLEYINNWSLIGDIKILLKTPFCLIGKEVY